MLPGAHLAWVHGSFQPLQLCVYVCVSLWGRVVWGSTLLPVCPPRLFFLLLPRPCPSSLSGKTRVSTPQIRTDFTPFSQLLLRIRRGSGPGLQEAQAEWQQAHPGGPENVGKALKGSPSLHPVGSATTLTASIPVGPEEMHGPGSCTGFRPRSRGKGEWPAHWGTPLTGLSHQ